MYFTKDDNDFRVQCMKNIFYRKIRLDSIKETIIRKFTFLKSQNLTILCSSPFDLCAISK